MSASTERRVKLTLLVGAWDVVRLPPEAPLPDWLDDSPPSSVDDRWLTSVTRTPDELSIVCPSSATPDGATAERGFACLKVQGPLPFSEIGILAGLAAPLAEAGISLFALSTFDTDYLLVRKPDLERAIAALEAAGHIVDAPPAAGS